MRRIIIGALILAAVLGCATFKKGADQLCNPTDQQKATAQAAIVFIDTLLLTIDPGSQLYLTWTKAKLVFSLIKAGTCVTYEQLKEALATVDQIDNVAKGQAALTGKPKVAKPDLSLLAIK